MGKIVDFLRYKNKEYKHPSNLVWILPLWLIDSLIWYVISILVSLIKAVWFGPQDAWEELKWILANRQSHHWKITPK